MAMKRIRRFAVHLVLVTLLVPQLFVLIYFFPNFFRRFHALGLAKAVFVHALTVSWVSAPLVALLVWAYGRLIRRETRWHLVLGFCVMAGYFWLAAWNLLIYPTYDYVRAGLPILLFGLGMAGVAWARGLYLRDLPVSKGGEAAPGPDTENGPFGADV
jgi:hypothetical protein